MDNQPVTTLSEAIFNIGAVSRMTGIPIASLHAWERRYGFPHSSARTPGGHRLYSEKDVLRLRSVKAQIDRGITAHQAVLTVQKMDLADQFPSDSSKDAPSPIAIPSAPSPAGHDQLSQALYEHDLARADQLLAEMLAFTSPEDITLNVIRPVLSELGTAWAEGGISVSDEHLASNYLRHRLLMWMVTGPAARPGNPIVLACGPGELHEGGLLMLGVLLRRQGWPIAYLGQDVPFADLAVFLEQIQPKAVVLVGMLEKTARLLADWPTWIKQIEGKPIVTFAGRAFVIQPELKNLLPGIYLGESIQDGLAKLEELLR